MTVFWTLIAAVVIGLAIGVPLAWWINRPTPDCYEDAVRRHEAFGRVLKDIVETNRMIGAQEEQLRQLKASIRRLETTGRLDLPGGKS